MELLKTAFLLIPQTYQMHYWKELEETITKYSILPKNELRVSGNKANSGLKYKSNITNYQA